MTRSHHPSPQGRLAPPPPSPDPVARPERSGSPAPHRPRRRYSDGVSRPSGGGPSDRLGPFASAAFAEVEGVRLIPDELTVWSPAPDRMAGRP
jgi:hypothetical protein